MGPLHKLITMNALISKDREKAKTITEWITPDKTIAKVTINGHYGEEDKAFLQSLIKEKIVGNDDENLDSHKTLKGVHLIIDSKLASNTVPITVDENTLYIRNPYIVPHNSKIGSMLSEVMGKDGLELLPLTAIIDPDVVEEDEDHDDVEDHVET